jgi:hypothetical protein
VTAQPTTVPAESRTRIRAALKQTFGIVFAIDTTPDGSLTVAWADGPVVSTVAAFVGARFGLDLTYSRNVTDAVVTIAQRIVDQLTPTGLEWDTPWGALTATKATLPLVLAAHLSGHMADVLRRETDANLLGTTRTLIAYEATR